MKRAKKTGAKKAKKIAHEKLKGVSGGSPKPQTPGGDGSIPLWPVDSHNPK